MGPKEQDEPQDHHRKPHDLPPESQVLCAPPITFGAPTAIRQKGD
jgi:hypothetical protein